MSHPWHLLAPYAWLVFQASLTNVSSSNVSADWYLSDVSFPGLFLLARSSDGHRFRVYRDGQKSADGVSPVEVHTSAWSNMTQARAELERALKLPSLEPLQSQWALFDWKGRRLDDLPALRQSEVVFLIRIGQWMWPAVRIGFMQEASLDHHGGLHSVTLETISLRPVIFKVRDFCSDDEIAGVLRVGSEQDLHKSDMTGSKVFTDRGVDIKSIRSSRQTWLRGSLSPHLQMLDGRVSQLTRIDVAHQEPFQLLQYGPGEQYHRHLDIPELEVRPNDPDLWKSAHFGHQGRLLNVFFYLNNVSEGGETNFPKFGFPICYPEAELGGKKFRKCPEAPEPSEPLCAKGLTIAPEAGAVILWYNYHASGRWDRNSLHAGCPVGAGLTKWSANKWVYIKPRSERAGWVFNHPALKRFGWTGNFDGSVGHQSEKGSEQLGRESRQTTASNKCRITFTNTLKVPANIMWMHPKTKQYQVVSSVKPGKTGPVDSFVNHQFAMKSQSSGAESNTVTCQPGLNVILSKKSAGGMSLDLSRREARRPAQEL